MSEISADTAYAVSRTRQDKQRKPSVKTLRTPRFAEFWRHCVLGGFALTWKKKWRYQLFFFWVGIEPTTSRIYSHTVPLRHDCPDITLAWLYKKNRTNIFTIGHITQSNSTTADSKWLWQRNYEAVNNRNRRELFIAQPDVDTLSVCEGILLNYLYRGFTNV